jgi:RNA polymerase sigma-70 factor (ECF subfamily)
MAERTNEEWISALSGDKPDTALTDLRAILVRGLGSALSSYDNVSDADVEDFAQDALLKILDNIDSFRGESRFTTWAQKIAVRVALSELRRLRWRDWSLERVSEGSSEDDPGSEYTPSLLADPNASPEEQAVQNTLLDVVNRTIAEKLTERQRIALVAVGFQGVPLDEVAVRLGTNRNALYKLLHDARKRLKTELAASGLPLDEIVASFETPA